MAKLYAETRSERGVEKHQIANKQLCADFYYGSRDESIKAFTVCATVEPDTSIRCPEKVTVVNDFHFPDGSGFQHIFPALPLCRTGV